MRWVKARRIVAGTITSVGITSIVMPGIAVLCWMQFEDWYSVAYAFHHTDAERYAFCVTMHWWQPLADLAWVLISPMIAYGFLAFSKRCIRNDETAGTLLFLLMGVCLFGFVQTGSVGLRDVPHGGAWPVITHTGSLVGCAVDHGDPRG